MWLVANSLAIDFADAHNAAFDPEYALWPLSEHNAAIEEIATIEQFLLILLRRSAIPFIKKRGAK